MPLGAFCCRSYDVKTMWLLPCILIGSVLHPHPDHYDWRTAWRIQLLLHAHQPQCFSDASSLYNQVLCFSMWNCLDWIIAHAHIACFWSILTSGQSKQEPLYLYYMIRTCLSLSCSLTLSPWVSPLPKSGLCHLFLGLNCVTKPPAGGALWNATSFHCCFWAGAVLLQTSESSERNQRQCELHNKCACEQRQRHSPIAAVHGRWEKGSQEVKRERGQYIARLWWESQLDVNWELCH